MLTIGAASAVAGPGDVGYEGPSYAGGATEITGEKPESKIWWNDGSWWASMYAPAVSDFHIFRLDKPTQTWVDTGVAIDDRPKTKADTLWDAASGKLYVASHIFSSGGSSTAPSRLYRYSYSAATDTYSLDSGFPVNIISNFSGETLVIDKDSTGQLWATWRQGTEVWVNRTVCSAATCSLNDDKTWGAAFVPAVNGVNAGSTTISSDDISSIVAFGGNKIGLFWTNQAKHSFYFAVHNDSAADTTWDASKQAIGGNGVADDHANLKVHAAANGKIYAVVKTSLGSGATRIYVLVRDPVSGNWSAYTHSKGSDNLTRPILMIDETNNMLHVFATEESGGNLYVKKTPLSAISFGTGKGTPVIVDADAFDIENPTSAKHNVTTTTGLVVLASNELTKRYWHHYDPLDGSTPPPPGNTLPVAVDDAYSMTQSTTLTVPAAGVLANDTDADADPLTAAKMSNPANGTVTVNADGSFTYTPTTGFTGVDTFKYTASDAVGPSNPATVSITVNPPSSGATTFTAAEDSYVRSNAATENNGAAVTVRSYKSGGSETRTYLKFNVSGLSGAASSAKLRLLVKDASAVGGALYRVTDSSWSESTIIWNNKPALGSLITNIGTVSVATWIEIDVTSSITGNGLFSFAIGGLSSDAAWYSSSEGTNAPELVIGGSSGGGGNTPPVAANNSYSMTQGTTLNVAAPGVLGNDSDGDGDSLTAVKLTDPANGTLNFNSDGSFDYTPTVAFTGAATFTYKANDGTDDSGTATVSITVNPSGGGGGGTTTTFAAAQDTFVRSNFPTENNGAVVTVRAYKSGSSETHTYLMFTVSGLSGSATSAKVRLLVKDASPAGGALYTVSDTGWSEGTMTWNTRPVLGSFVANLGAAALAAWVEIDVSSIVTGNGTYSFAVTGLSSDAAWYSSKEGTNAPQLVVVS